MLPTTILRPASATFLLSLLSFEYLTKSFAAGQLVGNSVTLDCEYMPP